MKSKHLSLELNQQETLPTLPGFPISCLLTTFTEKGYQLVDWHWHEQIQICYTTEGSILWSTDHQQFEVEKGKAFFINSQVLHRSSSVTTEASYFCLAVPPSFLCPDSKSQFFKENVQTIIDEGILQYKVLDSTDKLSLEIIQLLKEIVNLLNSQESIHTFEIISKVFTIWSKLFIMFKPLLTGTPVIQNDRAKQMILYIQKHFSEPMTLSNLASHLQLSRSETSREFKRHLNQTMSEYLLHYRLKTAQKLLVETKEPIVTICYQCGFNDQSYFTKKFREVVGLTPKQYRNKQSSTKKS